MRELTLNELNHVSGGFNLGELTTTQRVQVTLGSGAANGLSYAQRTENPTINGYIANVASGAAMGAVGVWSKNVLLLASTPYVGPLLGDKIEGMLNAAQERDRLEQELFLY